MFIRTTLSSYRKMVFWQLIRSPNLAQRLLLMNNLTAAGWDAILTPVITNEPLKESKIDGA